MILSFAIAEVPAQTTAQTAGTADAAGVNSAEGDAATPEEAPEEEEDAPSLYRRGEDALRGGDLYRAIDYFKEALRYNADYVEPLHGLAEVFFLLGEYSEAENYVRRARRLARLDSEIAALEGRIYTGIGRFDEAGNVFSSILRREPNNLDAQFGLAELEVARGRSRNALDVYLGALRSYPRNRRGLLSAALLYRTQGEYEEAGDLLKTAVRYYPDDPKVQAMAASLYYETGEYTTAKNHAARALAEDPGNKKALQVLIDIHFANGNYAEAVPELERSLEQDGDLIQWYSLGKARAETGEVQGALRAFTAALRLRPDDEVSRIVMEDVLIRQVEDRDSSERREAAEKRFERAAVYENNNRTEPARQEYRRGLELAPYHQQGRINYARTFKRSGDYEKYLSLLEVVENEGGYDRGIGDEIEIFRSMTEDTVSNEWGVNQFAIERDTYTIALFADTGQSSMLHAGAELPLLRYMRRLLHGYEQLKVVSTERSRSFASSFRNARRNSVDYFLVFSFSENKSTFTAEASVYHGNTGSRLTELRSFRTGNDRVAGATMRLVKDFQALLPVRGRIYRRDGEQLLLDIGKFHGVEAEETLKVLREGDIRLKSRSFALEFSEEDILGEVQVTRSDELISEGTLSTSSFFDLVNPTDVVFMPQNEEENASAENGDRPAGEETREQSGAGEAEFDVNSSAIYKSLLQIN